MLRYGKLFFLASSWPLCSARLLYLLLRALKVGNATRNEAITANRCYFRLSRQWRGKTLYPNTKLYESLIPSNLLYGVGAWTMQTCDESALEVEEVEEDNDLHSIGKITRKKDSATTYS